jgi:hypothetical protein
MKQATELIKALRLINDKGANCFPAVVVAVDKTKSTCDVEFNEMEIGEVRIQATVADNLKGLKMFPAVGSVVIIEKLGDKGEYLVKLYSEVEQVIYEIDNTHFAIKDGFLIGKNDDTIKLLLHDLINTVKAIVVPTNVGLSGNPLNVAEFNSIYDRVTALFK